MFIQRYCVYASPTEHAQLEQVARQGTTPQKVARRARMVLMLSHHESPSAVARTLHVSRMTVRLWANRFVTDGVPGVLRDASRPGRRKQLSPAKVQAIVDATLTTRPPAGTHWSSRSLAKAQDVSDGTIRKIWRQHGLQPHRVGRFKLSTDPHFVEKLRDVVGLYVNPPAKAVVFCVDEKSGIQALDRTHPVLPLRPGVPERQTHDYVRHGTTTLYAALRVLDGVVIGECRRRHRTSVDTSKAAINRHLKSGISGMAAETGGVLPRGLCGTQVGLDLRAPAAWPALEDMAMMQQAIQQGGDGRGVAESFAPVVNGPV